MVLIQLDIPEGLNKQIAIKKIKLGLSTKRETIIKVLEEALK